MSELSRLLRQAARITAGVAPNTDRAVEDHKGDAAYMTALASEKKASRKKADQSPNTPRAEEDHKGDAAYETALSAKVGSRRKKAEEEVPVEFEGSADAETAEDMFGGEEEITNADMIEALEDVKQGIEDVKVELGDDPASALLGALAEVLDAVSSMQDSVAEDAMQDPEAKVAFKSASQFKQHFIRERNIKAAKVIRKRLASLLPKK